MKNVNASGLYNTLYNEYLELAKLYDVSLWFNNVQGYAEIRRDNTYYEIAESLAANESFMNLYPTQY